VTVTKFEKMGGLGSVCKNDIRTCAITKLRNTRNPPKFGDCHLFSAIFLLDEHAQWEIRQYANAIAEIVMKWLPLTWAAFHDYVLHAVT